MVLIEAQTNGVVPITYNSYASATDIIDNGKITKINSEYIEDSIYLNTIIEIDYNNQNLNKLNKSDYKLVNKNSWYPGVIFHNI